MRVESVAVAEAADRLRPDGDGPIAPAGPPIRPAPQVHPDGAILETDTDNNQASLVLQVGQPSVVGSLIVVVSGLMPMQ